MFVVLATGVLQRFGDLIVAGTVLALAAFGYQHGLFLAVLAGMHALVSIVVALAFAEPVAALLASYELPAAYGFPTAFGILLLGTAVAIRLMVGAYVPADVVRLAPPIDKLGGGLIGAVAGMIVAGTVLVALSVAPLPDTLRIDGERLGYDMGTRLLKTFARCVEPNNDKRAILLDGEPGTVPLPAPDDGHHDDEPHDEGGDQGSGAAATDGPEDASENEHKHSKPHRHKSSKADAVKPATPPPPPPPAWSEPFADTNGNKSYDEGERYLDTDNDKAFTLKLIFEDRNGNGRRDIGLLERYRLHAWGRQVVSLQAVDAPPLVDPPPAADAPPGDEATAAGQAPPEPTKPEPKKPDPKKPEPKKPEPKKPEPKKPEPKK